MPDNTRFVPASILLSMLCFVAATAPTTVAASVASEWNFNRTNRWSGWTPNGAIQNADFAPDHVVFDATGSDPQLLSPLFDVTPASNRQWVEIDMDCAAGSGELYFTNTTQGQYGGLRPAWRATFEVTSPGRQTLRIWPFWEGLGKIIRLRLDPPAGSRCKLYAVRIAETRHTLGPPQWSFDGGSDPWMPMHAVTLDRQQGKLIARAEAPQAILIAPVEPFQAAEQSILKMDASCHGENLLTLYWVSDAEPGLFGQPVPLDEGKRTADQPFDLRQFPEWKGRITHLAIGFGTLGGETLTLDQLALEPNDPDKTFLRVRYLGFENAINRPYRPAKIRIELEHAGGPPYSGKAVRINARQKSTYHFPMLQIPRLGPGESFTDTRTVMPIQSGPLTCTIDLPQQQISATLRVDERLPKSKPPDYDVPQPRPVKTDYRIGIYYFPGWAPDQLSRWKRQAGFPERDPVLGWYAEGRPEVADWHIKWAVENGISFFVYDWYWRDGKEELSEGLNDGFLKARYHNLMNFAVMWANHRPFSDHTPEQLLEVTDYWIEHYFRQPNYLKSDGRPYVSFFSPAELLRCLGSPEKTREALDAMRDRVKAAGFPGLHIAACAGKDLQFIRILADAGFDSVTAYNYPQTVATTMQSPYRQFVLGHETIWQRIEQARLLPYTPLLTVGWDSRPWHGPRAMARFARRPEDFADALKRLKAHLDADHERMAILEAWNEWGEGSYIEPNVEFGFADLESIRKTFARPGNWPQNMAPVDLGLRGKYDLRNPNTASSSAANSTGSAEKHAAQAIQLQGVHPAVREGLQLECLDKTIRVAPGRAVVGERTWSCEGGEVAVTPAPTHRVGALPMTLNSEPVKAWRGGNRLTISRKDQRNATPGSYVPGSLAIHNPEQPDMTYKPARDYVVDEEWGAFALTGDGRLKPGQPVEVTYDTSWRRIGALILDGQGRLRLIEGEPAPDCPLPPEIPSGALRLTNVYRPFYADEVKPEHIYIPTLDVPDLSPKPVHPSLQSVISKLRHGQPVTIVCWGDSVTVGGDASSPETSYVGQFQRLLRRRYPDAAIDVINAGIGGSNTYGRLPGFQKEVLDHKPDLVTLEFVNDMGFPDDQLHKRYAEILEKTRDGGAALILITPHFTRPASMGHACSRGKDNRHAVAFLRRFAAENNVPLADASRRWEQLEHQGLPYETLLRNGINHPDDRGHLIFAEELMRFFP